MSNKNQPPKIFYKKEVLLKISQNLQENFCVEVSFLIKMQAFGDHLWIGWKTFNVI